MFYDWHEALKIARKHKELIDGQMVQHNKRVKQGFMREWKKFTLKSRAEKHCNKTVTSKVWICYSLYSNFQLSMSNCSAWFCFTSPCDWSRKLVTPSQPIRCKTKNNRDLAVCLFSLWVLIGSLWDFLSLWLAVVITLVRALRHSVEMHC